MENKIGEFNTFNYFRLLEMKKQTCILFTRPNLLKGFVLLFVLFSVHACKPGADEHTLNEGAIEYNITYLEDTLDNFMLKFLPNKMVVMFRDYNTVNKIQGLSGVVSFTHIQNLKEDKGVTLVHLLNKRYIYHEEPNEPSLFYDPIAEMTITPTGNTKEICGLVCAESRVVTPDDKLGTFLIYYTEKLHIPNANAHTPFTDVEGVLLEFQLKLYDVRMKFTANNIQEGAIDKQEFEIPKDYKPINKETMEEIMSLLK